MHRLLIGLAFATMFLPLPALGLGDDTADKAKAKPTAFSDVTVVAKAHRPSSKSAKGSVELLESFKKARKEKGGGK